MPLLIFNSISFVIMMVHYNVLPLHFPHEILKQKFLYMSQTLFEKLLIQDEMLKTALPLLIEQHKEQQRNGGQHLDFGEPYARKKGTLEERMTILSVAYHNYAVELEYLNKVGRGLT